MNLGRAVDLDDIANTPGPRSHLTKGNVACEAIEKDRYGRTVPVCRLGTLDLNGWLVEEGLAGSYHAQESTGALAVERALFLQLSRVKRQHVVQSVRRLEVSNAPTRMDVTATARD